MDVRRVLAAFWALFYITVACAEEECKPWGVTLFLAEGSTQGIEKIITDANLHLRRSFFGSVEVIRQFHCLEKLWFLDNIKLEVEGQVIKHWGKQHNWELTFAPLLHLNTVTLFDAISMNFGIGDGISQYLGNGKFEQAPAKTMNFWLMEGVFFLPDKPEWHMVLRLHHRCKCWGVFSNHRKSGSNFIALGLRYRFD
jgi:hypothetical protein